MREYDTLYAGIDQLLEQEPRVYLAIDGHAASGKTSLALYLKERYACNVIHMDHFFLRPEQQTADRLAEPGGNIDYERFKTEVQKPLLAGEDFAYRPWNCQTGEFGKKVDIKPNHLNIIEGAYSLHPTLAESYHIKVFLTIPLGEQLRRIEARDGATLLERFQSEWLPMERRYFETMGIAQTCDFIFGEEPTP